MWACVRACACVCCVCVSPDRRVWRLRVSPSSSLFNCLPQSLISSGGHFAAESERNCERQGLQSVTPWLSIKVMLPGNPVAWQPSWFTHRRRQRERETESLYKPINLSMRFPYLISGSLWSFLDFIVSSGCKRSLSVKVLYFYNRFIWNSHHT